MDVRWLVYKCVQKVCVSTPFIKHWLFFKGSQRKKTKIMNDLAELMNCPTCISCWKCLAWFSIFFMLLSCSTETCCNFTHFQYLRSMLNITTNFLKIIYYLWAMTSNICLTGITINYHNNLPYVITLNKIFLYLSSCNLQLQWIILYWICNNTKILAFPTSCICVRSDSMR